MPNAKYKMQNAKPRRDTNANLAMPASFHKYRMAARVSRTVDIRMEVDCRSQYWTKCNEVYHYFARSCACVQVDQLHDASGCVTLAPQAQGSLNHVFLCDRLWDWSLDVESPGQFDTDRRPRVRRS